ncbi:alpha/beta hydrolase [Xylanimonas ulmi]|uniref:Alpha-beta hydrolase superfamily lysophospholipase n=1 Tax=Xylanimonas ulmi TaxID=228973 RepID=A0A4V2EXW7_9MICO|nr:alpha/beta hydrolase [Xylanibacterium ulmi]RZS60930.1 alpha-beta hydrolase superfamily lysophospholipase [Xylanibacterium ulmi]
MAATTLPSAGLDWRDDDLLGAPFEQAPLGPATLVRLRPTPDDVAAARGVVLHVHGYNDYFFHAHLARAFADAGYLFHAVDLRAAGRSLRPGQTPHYVTDLREQGSDVAAASAALRAAYPLPLVAHAHSTGGLTTSLWAHAHRHATGTAAGPDALVLDSPFLELPGSEFGRAVGTRVLDRLGSLRPLTALSHGPSWYATALLRENGGRWEFDTTLKRPDGVPARAGWLRAVRRAQARVARGLAIACPVLLAASAASSRDAPDNPLVDSTDTVLDVEQIVARAPRLGRDVTVLRIEGGVHDLALSADGPRQAYLDAVLGWLATALRPAVDLTTERTA